MLGILLKKMKKNFWMVLCLIIGCSMAISLISSVPIYSRGIFNNILKQDFIDLEKKEDITPGEYNVTKMFKKYSPNAAKEAFSNINDVVNNYFIKKIGIPVLSEKVIFETECNLKVINNIDAITRVFRIEGITDFEKHVEIINGKMFSNSTTKDGVYEAVISQKTMKEMEVVLGKTYIMKANDDAKPISVKIVGIYKYKNKDDTYWIMEDWNHNSSMIIDYNLFANYFMNNEEISLSKIQWYATFDHKKIKYSNANNIKALISDHKKFLSDNYDADAYLPMADVLESYTQKEAKLRTFLLIFQIPIIIMLLFYIAMISDLIIDNDRNEIAVLKSRGASRKQIMKGYFFESIVISLISLLVGPSIGAFLCKILGTTDGFLKFANRAPMDVSLTHIEYIYSIVVLVMFIITMMIPAYNATKKSIVEYKLTKVKGNKEPLWAKYYLDILFFAITAYGIYSYKVRQRILFITGASGTEIPIFPILYVMYALFVLGAGLVFLRIYPHIISWVFKLGKSKWSPSSYISLVNVKRAEGQNQFLMLFLIFTVSFGLFNIKSAGNLNNDIEAEIRYMDGAEVKFQSNWQQIKINKPGSKIKMPPLYIEPNYSQYKTLNGAESITRVFSNQDATLTINNKSRGMIYLMGIDSYEFGQTAWMPNRLNEYHINHYLNILSVNPPAIFLSHNLYNTCSLKEGDIVYIKWGLNRNVPCKVAGYIDYWPTYNPNKVPGVDFIVGNLSYFQSKMPKEPYDIWVKLKEGSGLEKLYKDIESKNIPIVYIENANEKLQKEKNDPGLQGMNSSLTLGYLSTITITALGFLIYWILSIKGRILQFGVLRAMGMSIKNLIGILAKEQILISGISIIFGVVIGEISSSIFMPLVYMATNSTQNILPMGTIPLDNVEYIRMGMVILAMLLTGVYILARYVSRIKVDQAIKLGED